MPRTPIKTGEEEQDFVTEEDGAPVDASLLPFLVSTSILRLLYPQSGLSSYS